MEVLTLLLVASGFYPLFVSALLQPEYAVGITAENVCLKAGDIEECKNCVAEAVVGKNNENSAITTILEKCQDKLHVNYYKCRIVDDVVACMKETCTYMVTTASLETINNRVKRAKRPITIVRSPVTQTELDTSMNEGQSYSFSRTMNEPSYVTSVIANEIIKDGTIYTETTILTMTLTPSINKDQSDSFSRTMSPQSYYVTNFVMKDGTLYSTSTAITYTPSMNEDQTYSISGTMNQPSYATSYFVDEITKDGTIYTETSAIRVTLTPSTVPVSVTTITQVTEDVTATEFAD